MTSETRKILEQKLGLTSADDRQSSAPDAETAELIDSYQEAPKSYKKEYAELFKSLSPEFRKYLHERESETEKGFSRINNELNALKWVNEYYFPRQQILAQRGFKQARDYFEALARLDEEFEHNPPRVLKVLTAVYGDCSAAVPAVQTASSDTAQEINLNCRLQMLERQLAEISRYLASRPEIDVGRMVKEFLDSKTEEAEKAKKAAFAPKGKLADGVDLSELSTRELLELKMRDMD